MTTQRTLTTVLSPVLGFVLIALVLTPGQATAADSSSNAQLVAISQTGTNGPVLLGTDDDPWH